MPDIDIDFYDRNKVLELVPYHVAMRNQKGEQVKHNTGVYFTNIPHNPFTNLSTIEYEEAESRGYFKLDFLNVSMYEGIKNEEHLVSLLKEPNWELLRYKEIVDQLFHINGHFEIVDKLKPTSIEQLAAVLAIIRPAKRYLVNSDWNKINAEVWTKSDEGYFFKKSHAIAYAHAIVVQINALCEQVEPNDA